MSTINVNVKSSSDKKFVIAIETSKTVLDLKNAIAEQTEVAAERQRLIYSGRVLKDHDTLADYKIADGNTVHMVKSSGGAGASGASRGMLLSPLLYAFLLCFITTYERLSENYLELKRKLIFRHHYDHSRNNNNNHTYSNHTYITAC